MVHKRTRSIAIVGTLILGSFGALAMLPADPQTIARVTAAAPTGQSEIIANIDALLGPPPGSAPVVEVAIAPVNRDTLPAASPAWANLQTAALTEPLEEPAPIATTDAIGTSAVNLRAGPFSGAATLSVLQPGQPIQISGEQDGWIEVTLPDGGTGWVYARYVAGNEPPPVADAPKATAKAVVDGKDGKLSGRTARIETAVAVRSKPSAGARTIFHTEPGERVRIIGSNGNWLQIRTVDGNLGWIQYSS